MQPLENYLVVLGVQEPSHIAYLRVVVVVV